MDTSDFSRAFSRRALLTAASAVSGSVLLSACGSKNSATTEGTAAASLSTSNAKPSPSVTSASASASDTASTSPAASPSSASAQATANPTVQPEHTPESTPAQTPTPQPSASEEAKSPQDRPQPEPEKKSAEPEQQRQDAPTSVESNPASLRCLVNKTRPFEPLTWQPHDLVPFYGQQLRAEAAKAGHAMMKAAAADGVTLTVSSAYRSYAVQQKTYQHWVKVNGQKTADTLSARPGYSEHQTGLAVDFGSPEGCLLQECYQDTHAGQWLVKNAPNFGFILRFPKNQQHVTGYIFEPWHYRYVGPEMARQYQASGARTWEEFLGSGPAPEYVQK